MPKVRKSRNPGPVPAKPVLICNFKSLNKKVADVDAWRELVCGKRCWECFSGNAGYKCPQCHRVFHKRCVFMKGYPLPSFNLSVKEVVRCEDNDEKVVLIRCPECLAAANTEIAALRQFSLDTLNWTLYCFAQYLVSPQGNNYETLLNLAFGDKPQTMTLKMIQEKAKKGEYKSIEGFLGDLRLIKYDAVESFGVQSEETEVADKLFNIANCEFYYMKACPDCYSRRWGDGVLKSKQELSSGLLDLCTGPHIIVWTRFPGFPTWPAKLIKLEKDGESACVQCFFDGDGGYRHISKDLVVLYSQHVPHKRRQSGDQLTKAVAAAKLYLSKCEEKFGAVKLPPMTESLGKSTLRELQKRIYPNYQPENAEPYVSSRKKLLLELARDKEKGQQTSRQDEVESIPLSTVESKPEAMDEPDNNGMPEESLQLNRDCELDPDLESFLSSLSLMLGPLDN